MIYWIVLYVISGLISMQFFRKTWRAWSIDENGSYKPDSCLFMLIFSFVFGPVDWISTMIVFKKKHWTLF